GIERKPLDVGVEQLGDRLEIAVDEGAVSADDDFDGFQAHARSLTTLDGIRTWSYKQPEPTWESGDETEDGVRRVRRGTCRSDAAGGERGRAADAGLVADDVPADLRFRRPHRARHGAGGDLPAQEHEWR